MALSLQQVQRLKKNVPAAISVTIAQKAQLKRSLVQRATTALSPRKILFLALKELTVQVSFSKAS
jgi:hypothetical protein